PVPGRRTNDKQTSLAGAVSLTSVLRNVLFITQLEQRRGAARADDLFYNMAGMKRAIVLKLLKLMVFL
ncbi:uncharacterized, partial [Tachysurus ichikawai]